MPLTISRCAYKTNIILVFLFAGVMAMLVGILFRLPSLRIKGSVAVAARFPVLPGVGVRAREWFTDYAPSGSVAVGRIELFGYPIDTPGKTYIFVLATVVLALGVRTWCAAIGRMDGHARHGHRRRSSASGRSTPAPAFAISSFYIGIAGAL